MSVPLTRAVLEIEQHVAAVGWNQPPRLYALVETAELVRHEPALAGRLGGAVEDALVPGHVTPVEQDELPDHSTIEELLGGIVWPPEVAGTALVVERLMVPAEVEAQMPEGESEALRWLAEHPERQEVRIAVGVLRNGHSECAIRLRSHDEDTSVMSGRDLVPGLVDALAGTLTD
ncbi:MAG: PPA1309 family protein [Actinomycetota bacterium]|nr:PPA1309 family protein [Actinomycetota bacterium]